MNVMSMPGGGVLPDEFVLLLGFVMVVGLTLAALSNAMFVVGVTVSTVVLQHAMATPLFATAYGYNIFALDIISVASFAGGAVRLGTRGRYYLLEAFIAALIVYTLASFFFGLSKYGLTASVNLFRPAFYLISGMLLAFAAGGEPGHLDRLARIWIAGASVLGLAAVVGQIFPDLVWMPDGSWRNWQQYRYGDSRIFGAGAALIIAQGALILHFSPGPSTIIAQRTIVSVLLLIAVIILYHRSVWIATIAALTAIVLSDPRSFLRASLAIGGLALGMVLVWIMTAAVGGDLIGGKLIDASLEPFDTDSTLAWRVVGWKALVGRAVSGGPLTLLFGSGFGAGYDRVVDTGITTVSPHNLFVEVLVNSGVVGVAFWVVLFGWMILGLLRSGEHQSRLNATTALALIVSIVTFSGSYGLGVEQGYLIGAIAAMTVRSLSLIPAAPAMALSGQGQ